ncbi:hypothetical protein JQ580_23630 [Bradyrhizobium japonicum]|uniref:hypothetical protein n=1 Tax=Bradyrhizobium japonicum TaxID=375 RepID=UPI001BA98295|nr:hypothetical protein [Bradyrhizobium japonicum]MBR0993719.1 hypothetical protein [Bradyrhizobium japonicum]
MRASLDLVEVASDLLKRLLKSAQIREMQCLTHQMAPGSAAMTEDRTQNDPRMVHTKCPQLRGGNPECRLEWTPCTDRLAGSIKMNTQTQI